MRAQSIPKIQQQAARQVSAASASALPTAAAVEYCLTPCLSAEQTALKPRSEVGRRTCLEFTLNWSFIMQAGAALLSHKQHLAGHK